MPGLHAHRAFLFQFKGLAYFLNTCMLNNFEYICFSNADFFSYFFYSIFIFQGYRLSIKRYVGPDLDLHCLQNFNQKSSLAGEEFSLCNQEVTAEQSNSITRLC